MKIDGNAVLDKMHGTGISVSHWCNARGFSRSRLYNVIANSTLRRRDAHQAQKVLRCLKEEGFLVELPEDQDNPEHKAA